MPAETPASFADAAMALWADAGLDESVGRLYQTRAGSKATLPHAIFWLTKGAPVFRSPDTTVHAGRLKVRVRDASGASAYTRSLLVADAFREATFEWAGGYATELVEERQTNDVEKDFATQNATAYMQELEWSTRIAEE